MSKLLPKDPRMKILGIPNRILFAVVQRIFNSAYRGTAGSIADIPLGLSVVGHAYGLGTDIHTVFPCSLPMP